LLNYEKPEETIIFNLGNRDVQDFTEPTLDETKSQINNLKNHKSPGEDEIHAELLKKGWKKISFRARKLICCVWTNEELPAEWKTAVLCQIHKKGNIQDCNNYREIVLLNVTYKVLSNFILSRLKGKVEKTLGDYQGGLKPGRSTIDSCFKKHGSFTRRYTSSLSTSGKRMIVYTEQV